MAGQLAGMGSSTQRHRPSAVDERSLERGSRLSSSGLGRAAYRAAAPPLRRCAASRVPAGRHPLATWSVGGLQTGQQRRPPALLAAGAGCGNETTDLHFAAEFIHRMTAPLASLRPIGVWRATLSPPLAAGRDRHRTSRRSTGWAAPNPQPGQCRLHAALASTPMPATEPLPAATGDGNQEVRVRPLQPDHRLSYLGCG